MNKKNLFIAAGIFLLVVFSFSLFNPAPAHASFSGTDYQQIFEDNVFGDEKVNQPSFSNETAMATIASLNNMILGCTTEACKEKLGVNAGGAVGTVSNLIASLYATPPASSAYYLADLGQRLNLTQPVYAQGIGFSGLTPLLPLWKAARNVAYAFFILVFLIIGFAIMFRAKINPQTVVTIQSAIPKAVVALILVTFSYAIAGLMIDLMYLSIGLLFGLIPANFKTFLPHGSDVTPYYTGGFGELIHNVWDAGWGSFWRTFLEGLGIEASITVIGGIVGLVIGGLKVAPILIGAGVGAIIILAIVAIVFLFTTVKIFWTLLVSYINIIISILVAPVQLMISAIPGQNTFGAWFNNLLKNLLVFPAVIGMLLLAQIFSHLPNISPGSSLWVPPLLGFWGERAGEAIGGLLGLGVVLLTPKVADIIKSMFEKKPFAYGAAIGEAMGPGKLIGKTTGLYVAGETSRTLKRMGKAGTPQADWKATAGGTIEKLTGVKT